MAFPVVASSNTTADTSSTSITVAMPSGISAGDLLLVFVAQDANGTLSQSGGSDWTKLEQTNNGTVCGLAIFAKVAAGGDSLTLTSTNSQDAACVSVRITGHGVSNVSTDITRGTPATGADAAPDPPNCNPGSAKDYLWLEAFGADDDDDTATYWSTNYSAVNQVQSASSTSSCLCAVGQRALNASAENPGAMAMALAEEWVAQTLAIPPDLNVTGTGSAALSPFGASGSGAEAFAGTGSAALASFGVSATGSVANPIAGSGSAALGAFGAAGTGAESFAGTGSAALAAFACAATGAEQFSGSGSAALSPFACAGSGSENFSGSGSAALASFACASSGTVVNPITGAGSAALASFACGATGSESFSGSGSAAVSRFACSATGSQAHLGSGTAALSPFAAAGAGAEAFSGSGTAAVQPFGADGTGAQASGITGSGSAVLAPFGVDGSGAQAFAGAGFAALQSFAAGGAGALGFLGVGSAALMPFGASGSGLLDADVTGSGSAALQPFGASGSSWAANPIAGSGSAALAPFGAAGVGSETFLGAGSAALTPFGAGAAAELRFVGIGSAELSPFALSATGGVIFGTGRAYCRSPRLTYVVELVEYSAAAHASAALAARAASLAIRSASAILRHRAMSGGNFQIGNAVTVSVRFQNEAGADADPTNVSLRLRPPTGGELVKAYPGDIEKTATGRYQFDWVITEAGLHAYRWEGTGAVVAADESEFTIPRSRFEP